MTNKADIRRLAHRLVELNKEYDETVTRLEREMSEIKSKLTSMGIRDQLEAHHGGGTVILDNCKDEWECLGCGMKGVIYTQYDPEGKGHITFSEEEYGYVELSKVEE